MLNRVSETRKVVLHVPTWDSADLLVAILNPIQERRELELLVPVWEAWTSSDAGKRAAEHERWFEWDSCRRLVVAVHEHLRINPAAAVLIDA